MYTCIIRLIPEYEFFITEGEKEKGYFRMLLFRMLLITKSYILTSFSIYVVVSLLTATVPAGIE